MRFLKKPGILYKPNRNYFIRRFQNISALTFFPSRVPYILIRLNNGLAAETVCRLLAKDNILIRDCSNFKGLSDKHIRVALKSRVRQPDAGRYIDTTGEPLMTDSLSLWILPAAFALDLILGDPPFLPHPIRWMGNAIIHWEPRFRKLPVKYDPIRLSFCLIFDSIDLSASHICSSPFSDRLHPILGFLMETILVYYCISARSLKNAAMDVFQALHREDLETARQKIAMIVGRDVTTLDQQGITRAAVETVAENLVDGVLAPLFFAAIGGAPLAMAYKMVNTLDSMIGYKNEKYIDFGKTSARIDDVCNFIPARFSIPIIAISAQLLWKRGTSAFRTAIVEGK